MTLNKRAMWVINTIDVLDIDQMYAAGERMIDPTEITAALGPNHTFRGKVMAVTCVRAYYH